MSKNSIIALSAIIIVIIIGVFFWMNPGSAPATTAVSLSSTTPADVSSSTPVATSSDSTSGVSTGQLFANSALAQYAYLISTDTLAPATQRALSGFTLDKKVLKNGSVQYTLNSTNPEYHTQVYTVAPGQSLYFIEKSLGDDSANQERFLQDDSAVLVDQNGYIVQP